VNRLWKAQYNRLEDDEHLSSSLPQHRHCPSQSPIEPPLLTFDPHGLVAFIFETMFHILYSALALSAVSSLASAHGYLDAIEVNGVNYTAWQVWTDRFLDPQPIRATRPYRDNGPVDDFTTSAIT
jgi:hypothetical protein